MKSCGTYQVNSGEDHSSSNDRKKSYKICLLILLICFLIFVIIILSCLRWTNYVNNNNNIELSKTPFNNKTLGTDSIIDARDEKVDSIDNVTKKIDNNDNNNKPSICESGKCKQLTSKILSYMNHSADPCEDFYEYACGGMEADLKMSHQDLSKQVSERIKKSLEIYTNDEAYYSFVKYFNSCIKYNEYAYEEKLDYVKSSLKNIGSFYTKENWPETDGYSNIISQLIANMIIHDSPLLFDIVPDVDEMDPKKFILRINPVMNNYKFFNYLAEEESCIQNINTNFNLYKTPVNIKMLYDDYKSCKSHTDKSDNMTNWINDIHNSFFKIGNFIADHNFTVHFQILKKFFANYPASENEIRKNYRTKEYSVITLEELQSFNNLINWTHIIFELTGTNVTRDVELQIYFQHQILNALITLESDDKSHRVELNNALLGFYAANLYKQMVENEIHQNLHEQCLIISMNYLPKQSSALYISSFSLSELDYFTLLVNDVFVELKETLKLKFNNLKWTTNEGRKQLLQKLDDVKLILPNVSIFHNLPQENITDNFFLNTLYLMKKKRENMYNVFHDNPNDSNQLWTYFSNPIQTAPITIYSLGLIILPFGAIDWSAFEYEKSFENFIYSTIGNLLAREIAHIFDNNGIKYWNGTRVKYPFGLIDDDSTKEVYHNFINCQRDTIFQEPIDITIPLSNQQVEFEIPASTLNERLSDVMGLNLVHETLDRIHKSNMTELLPWLSLNSHQLFYLKYAQTYCTKSRLEDFYIPLYEKSILPNRIRILAIAINSQNIGKVWNCPEGSKILPPSSCDVFPDLEYQNTTDNLQIMIN